MRCCETARPAASPPSPEQFDAALDRLCARLDDGNFNCLYGFLEGGGFGVANVGSHDEVLDLMTEYPLYESVEWEVRPVLVRPGPGEGPGEAGRGPGGRQRLTRRASEVPGHALGPAPPSDDQSEATRTSEGAERRIVPRPSIASGREHWSSHWSPPGLVRSSSP
jgi:hypothetical protein